MQKMQKCKKCKKTQKVQKYKNRKTLGRQLLVQKRKIELKRKRSKNTKT